MGRRILIVEDEQELANLIKNRLEMNEYTATIASDGLKALEEIRQRSPDLIILDIVLPNMDGYTFFKEFKLKYRGNNIPIIVLTAKETMTELFKMEGVEECIIKPFDEKKLLEKIKKYLD